MPRQTQTRSAWTDREFMAHMGRLADLSRAIITVAACVAIAWLLAEAVTPCMPGALC